MQSDEIFLKSIDSTQKYAKRNYLNFNKKNITSIFSTEQTSGVGRFQKKWVSNNDNLNVTFYFTLDKNSLHFTSIGHILAISLAQVLKKNELDPKLKWPNDIMLSEKKLSGILCEIIIDDVINVFLGIGVNVNNGKDFLDKIDQNATSLKLETNKIWDKKNLFKDLKFVFLKNLETFKEKGFKPFHSIYENLLLYKNEKITFFDGKNKYTGILHSVDFEGRLNLYISNGQIKNFSAGIILDS